MRVLVAVFLVIGFGILRVASVNGSAAWAWVSVGVSVTAILVLVVDWRRKVAVAGEEESLERHGDDSSVREGSIPTSASADSLPGSSERGPRPDSAPHGAGGHGPDPMVDVNGDSSANGAAFSEANGSFGGVAGEVVGDPGRTGSKPEAPSPGTGAREERQERESVGSVGDQAPTLDGVVDPQPPSRVDELDPVAGEGQQGKPPKADHGAPPEAVHESAILFSPYRKIDEPPTESGDKQPESVPVPERTGLKTSDATEVFARVRPGDVADGDAHEGGGVAASPAPSEERADERSLAAVARCDVEVLVVDEYPRYHLARCHWLDGRAVIPVVVREAVELGFTPCEICAPVRELSGTVARQAEQAY